MNLDEIKKTKTAISFHILRIQQLTKLDNAKDSPSLKENISMVEMYVDKLTKQACDVTKKLAIIRHQLK